MFAVSPDADMKDSLAVLKPISAVSEAQNRHSVLALVAKLYGAVRACVYDRHTGTSTKVDKPISLLLYLMIKKSYDNIHILEYVR